MKSSPVRILVKDGADVSHLGLTRKARNPHLKGKWKNRPKPNLSGKKKATWTKRYLKAVARSIRVKFDGGHDSMLRLAEHFGIEMATVSDARPLAHSAYLLALDLEAISGVKSWRPNR